MQPSQEKYGNQKYCDVLEGQMTELDGTNRMKQVYRRARAHFKKPVEYNICSVYKKK